MQQMTLFDSDDKNNHSEITFEDMNKNLNIIHYSPDLFGNEIKKFTQKNSSKKINVLSLFSGAGGLDIGFEDAGFNIVEQNEIVEDFAKTLEINSENDRHVVCEDIHNYSGEHLKGKIDFIIGGPPCQPFSAAARRAFGVNGTIDARGTLFSEYVRVLKEVQPKGFLFENVYGIVSANHGEDWQMIIKAFKNAGYTLHYKILDAADYGTPQHRARLIIVGLNDNEPFFFPKPNHGPDSPDNLKYYTAQEALSNIASPENKNKLKVTGKYGHLLNDIPVGMNYSYYTSKIGNPLAIFAWRSKFSDFLYKADPNEPVKTIKANGGQYTGPFHWENRHFSVAELKALQTFPASYQLNGAKQIKVKQIGNSVPPQFARFLALSIRDEVFHMPMPFKMNYMPANYKLQFNKYKRNLSRQYYKKAKELLLSQENNISNKIKSHSHKALLTDGLLFNVDSSEYNYIYKVTINDKKLYISIWDKVNSSPKKYTDKLKIELTEPLGIQNFTTIYLESFSINPSSYTAMWRALEHELIEHHLKGDLVQLNGYYQYDPQLIITGEINKNFPVDKKLMDIIISNEITAKPFTLKNLSNELSLSEDLLHNQFVILKRLGYEIRNSNTNAQIPVGMWMIPYAFPTLTNLSVQTYKEL